MFHWLRDSYGFEMKEIDDLSKLESKDIIKFTIYHPTACSKKCCSFFFFIPSIVS